MRYDITRNIFFHYNDIHRYSLGQLRLIVFHDHAATFLCQTCNKPFSNHFYVLHVACFHIFKHISFAYQCCIYFQCLATTHCYAFVIPFWGNVQWTIRDTLRWVSTHSDGRHIVMPSLGKVNDISGP